MQGILNLKIKNGIIKSWAFRTTKYRKIKNWKIKHINLIIRRKIKRIRYLLIRKQIFTKRNRKI